MPDDPLERRRLPRSRVGGRRKAAGPLAGRPAGRRHAARAGDRVGGRRVRHRRAPDDADVPRAAARRWSPAAPFADLGCGAGMLAIAAARLGWEPVLAVDHEPQSVAATRRNAERNGVAVEALELDLVAVAPPPAPTLAANVRRRSTPRWPRGSRPRSIHVIASGFVGSERDAVVARLRGRRLPARRAARRRLAGGPAGARAMSGCSTRRRGAAAGARHGQLASGLPGGGLALSCHKLVEDGARVMMLLAPGTVPARRPAGGGHPPGDDALAARGRALGDRGVRRDRLRAQGRGDAGAGAGGVHVLRGARAAPDPGAHHAAARPSTASAASPTSSPTRSCARSSRARCAGARGLDYPRPPVDRDEIERQDFPAARRGYDAARCDEHLRRVADEFEALAARPRSASLAEGASTQVRAILEAAESSAQQLRDDAGREAGEHVERVGERREGAARQARPRCSGARPPADGLKSTAETLTASLEELSGEVRTLRGPDAVESPEPAGRALARRERRALRRRGRRPAGGAQHGARGLPARGHRPLPRRALRPARRDALLDDVYTSAGK